MSQTLLHYSLHFLAIAGIAWWYDKLNWKRNWLILISTMLVDLDHLLATPLFDPDRCSIGFHPLHSLPAIAFYLFGIFFVKNRVIKLVFIGLAFHMLTDLIDCIWTFSHCLSCYENSEIYKWVEFFSR